jgi:hypothetical protein
MKIYKVIAKDFAYLLAIMILMIMLIMFAQGGENVFKW